MKINKLFHWLYAFLMLLPLVVFLPSCLYYAFNEHADNGTQTATANIEYQYKYETNEVNNENDLVVGNIYHLNMSDFDGLIDITFYMLNGEIDCDATDIYQDEEYLQFTAPMQYQLYFDNGDYYIRQNSNVIEFTAVTSPSIDIDFVLYIFDDFYSENNLSTYITSSTFNVIESASTIIEYNNDNSIVNAMSSAWDNVWQLPLFSWSGNSFLTAPFNYITALFGIPNNSVFVYVLSYWLSISIIWMVFDIVIYVPMLIHRWLDKASLS